VKILINLQVGSSRVGRRNSTLCFRFKGGVGARFTWKPSRWSIPLVRWRLPSGRLTGGICSTRIDFQLGTNAADTNGLNGRREACSQKNTEVPADHIRKCCRKMSSADTCPAIAQKTAVDPRGRSSQDQSVARVAGFIPRRYRKNAPKKRTDITASQVLVHISCTHCHPTVILASPRVGACNENLSQ